MGEAKDKENKIVAEDRMKMVPIIMSKMGRGLGRKSYILAITEVVLMENNGKLNYI